MRGLLPSKESGHDHFFATFGKFGAAANGHTADMIEEVKSRAAKENLQYHGTDVQSRQWAGSRTGQKTGMEYDLAKLRQDFLTGGLPCIL